MDMEVLACFSPWGHRDLDITEQLKAHLVKAMVFPVVMYGCERWTVKKAERRSIDAFELWCLEKTLMLEGIRGRRRRGRQDEMAGWHH